MLGRKLALCVEFVTQVVEGVGLAVRVGAEGGAGGCIRLCRSVRVRARWARSRPISVHRRGMVSSAAASLAMADTAWSCPRATS